MRQRLPGDREIGDVEIGDGSAFTGDERNRLSTKPGYVMRQGRLVSEGRYDAERILTGNVIRREHRDDAGMVFDESIEVAEGEAGMIMRRAHHEH